MTPQKKKAIAFLALMVLVSAGMVVWNFVVNRGTLIVTGEVPFTVNVGAIHDKICINSPCEYLLPPKKYVLSTKKEGFFGESASVSIERWQKTEIAMSFRFRPVIRELNSYTPNETLGKFPNDGLDFGPEFDWSEIDLQKIPKNAKKVVFSESGRKAIVFLGKELYLFDHLAGKSASLLPLDIPDFEALTWSVDDKLILLAKVGSESAEKNQKLFLVDPMNTKNKSLIASFERPLNKPLIENSGTRVLIVENNVYEISLQKKSKRRVTLPESSKNFRLINENLVAYESDGKVYLQSLETGVKQQIPAFSSSAVLALGKNQMLAVSRFSGEYSDVTNVSFGQFMAMASQNIEKIKEGEQTGGELKWYFVGLNLENGIENLSAKNFASLAHGENESIEIFPQQKIGKNVYFVKTSSGPRESKKTLFTLQLSGS